MGLKSNLRGLGEALAYMSKGEMDELTKRSAFLTTRKGTENLYQTGFQKASDLAFKPMEMADTFSTQAVWRSRYYDNVAKGMGEDAAIKEADEFARGLFAGRSKGAMPTAFGSKTLKPLTMFQLEVNNQISYLTKDIPEANGLLLHAVYYKAGNAGVDEMNIWGCYFFMEALHRMLDPEWKLYW
jgi:hypothetical protein